MWTGETQEVPTLYKEQQATKEYWEWEIIFSRDEYTKMVWRRTHTGNIMQTEQAVFLYLEIYMFVYSYVHALITVNEKEATIRKRMRWGIWKGEVNGEENDIIIIPKTKNKKTRKETAYFSVHKLLPVTFSFPGSLTSMLLIVACRYLHIPCKQLLLWISSVLPSAL